MTDKIEERTTQSITDRSAAARSLRTGAFLKPVQGGGATFLKMRAQHIVWNGQSGWRTKGEVGDPSLVLYFGTREALACGRRYEELRAMYPAAHVLGCRPVGRSTTTTSATTK
jgi:hypothetical protein